MIRGMIMVVVWHTRL